jgi:type VI secretion system protein ImpA
MRFDKLLEPVSDEMPCGADLELEGDDAYIDYYYEALARIPERFLSGGQPFDRKEINLKSEVAAIAGLLDKTRDLRLLVIEAKFQALGGTIKGFSECVQACAMLIAERWEDVHPQIDGGDVTERRNQIELLDDRATIIMPLEHSPLFRDRRIDQVSFRDYQVASGSKEPRDGEKVPDAGAILTAIKSADNADQIEALYANLSVARGGITSMVNACKGHSSPFVPQVETVLTTLKQMIGFLVEARPDLAGASEEAATATDDETGDTNFAAPSPTAGGATMVAGGPPVAVGPIADHAHAKVALEAVENYYARIEPSSPGFILIRQARLLIGQPLITALETLLPAVAENARIEFGSENGFLMTVPRMKLLSDEATEHAKSTPPAPDLPAPPEIKIENREQASAMISNVETFFRQTEPSSPVPILLFKAKSYLNRDFSAIINDLFAHVKS